MESIRNFFIFMLVLGLNISCRTGTRDNASSKVAIYGHIDSIMAGNFSTVYEFDSLTTMDQVYALGAMDSMKGEIQIFDSQSFNSVVDGDSILVGAVGTNKAALLLFSQVNKWENYDLPLSVTNLEALVGFFHYEEQFEEVRTNEPFVFLLEGEAEQIDWHVIGRNVADSLATGPNHIHQALKGTLEEVDVEIFGIYSKEYEGIVTHRGIPVHIHFRTLDGKFAGHVDDLDLGPEMTLRIPNYK